MGHPTPQTTHPGPYLDPLGTPKQAYTRLDGSRFRAKRGPKWAISGVPGPRIQAGRPQIQTPDPEIRTHPDHRRPSPDLETSDPGHQVDGLRI